MTEKKHGWLTNLSRRKRRDRANTLTNKQVENMLLKINAIPEYISPRLEPKELDQQMRLRDSAIICVNWTWFKRASEVLSLRRKDIEVTEKELIVTFSIRKKKRRLKICPMCDETNGIKAKFCKNCSLDLTAVPVTEYGETKIIPKRKTLQYTFCGPVVEWLDVFDKLIADKESWIFPPVRVFLSSAYFDFRSEKPLTVQRYNQILQRLDHIMTSSMFRYGGAEKYLQLGFTPTELASVGDWESSRMPEVYAKRKDLSVAQRRFAEDIR